MDQTTLQAMEQYGVPHELDLSKYDNLLEAYSSAADNFANKPAFSCLGHTISFKQFQQLAMNFAAYLQHHTDLQPGDRVALQLPNILQYPVLLYGVLLADLVVVNTNPLYTPRELKHQLNDSGAKMLIVLANVANTAEQVLAESPVERVLVTEIADFHPAPKRWLINGIAKHVKRMVPSFNIPDALLVRDAMKLGSTSDYKPVQVSKHHLAVLQYTGGTTGVAKGAMLTHGNLIANIFQCQSLFGSYGLSPGQEIAVVPLPLYHIYSFTVCMVMMEEGNHCVLIPNPRDLDSLVRSISRYGMSFICGINTLFVALCNHANFKTVDFSGLKLTLSGGMALTEDAANQWHQVTGCEIHQGYGLTETAPVITGNPGGGNKVATIGLPVPSTDIRIISDTGKQVATGEQGELCMKGPQLMTGYWQRPEATAEAIDSDGWFHTGDVALVDSDGYYRIVDRLKDMIIVSGFNVYPNELEAVLSEHPGVLECAAIGVPDEESGEAVKMFVVLNDKTLRQEQLRGFCKARLTGYKVPKHFEFRDELPKSTVGKILRRELRDNP